MKAALDAYTLRARLAPAIIAGIPLLAIAITVGLSVSFRGAVYALAATATAFAVAGIIGDAGRHVEPKLFQSWEGAPTSRRLRWRDNADVSQLHMLHDRIARVTGQSMPTVEEEQADPQTADRRYADAIQDLRDLTRDKTRFPLVADQNAEYGFRRNSLGLRLPAIILAGVIFGLAVAAISAGWNPRLDWVASGLVALVCLLYWSLVVRAPWVRRAADLYATRLLETVATLSHE